MPDIDTHLIKRSMTGPADECGDTGVISVYDGKCFLALVDVLGHGKEAHEVSLVAERCLQENYGMDLKELMKTLHNALKGTRGAVAALCRLDMRKGEIDFVGTGNISAKLYGMRPVTLISRDGVIGYKLGTPRLQREKVAPGDTLILNSDGVTSHFDPLFYPGLLNGSAKEIAEKVMDRLGKRDDDASCIVLRYG